MEKEIYLKNNQKYYLGLDIGTDSVGYAVTDVEYNPLKFYGEPMMGTHLLDAANSSAERRMFRTSRRRLDRKQQRIHLLREIFVGEISKVDPFFFKRLDCSALFPVDKCVPSKNSVFNDVNYQDRDYNREYPTIHHLICSLMRGDAKNDVRLLYLAVAYLIAHRGHFLNEVDKDDIDGVLDFERIYNDFISFFETPIWNCNANEISEIIKQKSGVTTKEKALIELLFNGKKPKPSEDDICDRAAVVKLLAGGKVKLSVLFLKDEYSELPSISLQIKEEDLDSILPELGDDGELIILLKRLYDWSILAELTPGKSMISETKVKVFDQHKRDLRFLKYFIKKYKPEKYNEIFRKSSKELKNYVAYSYNVKSADDPKALENGKATKYEFCEYLLKIVKDIKPESCDEQQFVDMIQRLDKNTASFMPKQVDGDNRVIPYQLYYVELIKILDNAKEHFDFLNLSDKAGITPYEKIISIFLYRVPYYVGPLGKNTKGNNWVIRSEEKIYPWNFEEVVDLDKSEEAFISRMINKCTYLPGENVLPKNSLAYTKFEVLNEINNLKINGESIDVETKQEIFNNVFSVTVNVTPKKIKNYLISVGKAKNDDILSGIDTSIKSSLKTYIFFKPYMDSNILGYNDVEEILKAKAFSEDVFRFKKYLQKNYLLLSNADVTKIANAKFKEFGRLSRKFLCELEGEDKNTGEVLTVMEALWNTNDNLMQILSDKYTFADKLEAATREYYTENPESISERINNMYIPNAVKRPVMRTIDIVKDIAKAQKNPPEKIFIEMARGAAEEQKNKRTISRRDQILEFYKAYGDSDELKQLKEELALKNDRELRGEALYLYFIQLGKCMYSGETININALGTSTYNVDHIYPRSFVKDDSINNKVLVLSTINGEKSNEYPINAEIRASMFGYWKSLLDKGLISDVKFKRLTRSTPFTEEERWNFINRQLVETRQSTKAVATLLKELFPKTEIVYVKAGLVSEFRQAFDLLKARSVNDLHHAKDAYLNIVVGNVYNSVFTKKWFNPSRDEYSLKAEVFFGRTHSPNGITVWEGGKSIAFVKKTVSKNNIHITKYALCKHGGFFDQMPVKAGSNDLLVPRKKGLDPAKYGGYNKTSASFFVLVKFEAKGKTDIAFMPVELLYADRFMADCEYALSYSRDTLTKITNNNVTNIEFPLGMRKIKINTVLELDGFRVFLCGKSSGGSRFNYSSLTSLKIGDEWETYVKRLESFAEKKNNPNIHVSTRFDKISHAENTALYEVYREKSWTSLFNKTLCSSVAPILESGKEKFERISVEEQVTALLNIGSVFKTGRKGGCDLSAIGGAPKAGALVLSSRVSNWKKTYSTAYIVDMSASGLYEKKSVNLFELL